MCVDCAAITRSSVVHELQPSQHRRRTIAIDPASIVGETTGYGESLQHRTRAFSIVEVRGPALVLTVDDSDVRTVLGPHRNRLAVVVEVLVANPLVGAVRDNHRFARARSIDGLLDGTVLGRYFVHQLAWLDGSVDAPRLGLTTVLSALVLVVAVGRNTGLAGPLVALIADRTQIGIIAGCCIRCKIAPRPRNARIGGAVVVVVAREFPATRTRTGFTGIRGGAGVLVIAGAIDVIEDASGFPQARIAGAGIAVVASTRAFRNANPIVARPARAIPRGRNELTARLLGARILCTRVAVVAGQLHASQAFAQMAVVDGGADVPVVAKRGVELGDATQGRIAQIVRAGIGISAVQFARSRAHTVQADIQLGAGITIVALIAGELLPDASDCSIAGIARAWVAVVTHQDRAARASAVYARILGRTDIAVIAPGLVVLVQAAAVRVARIIGARVAVIAVDRHPAGACSVLTFGTKSALVTILAKLALVCKIQSACPGLGVTHGLQAKRVFTFRLGTHHHRCRIDHALVWELLGVALECAVAQVAVFERGAIRVGQAVARDRLSPAFPVYAVVPQRAWILVITRTGHCRVVATPHCGAQVFGAGIVIIANHRVAHTGPGFAMVSHRARVPVLASTALQNLVHAPAFARARIRSAVVAVVAQLQVLAFHQLGLVSLVVAIVVKTVAGLRRRSLGIAVRKAILQADPLPLACTVFVLHPARSPQAQFHRGIRAGALAGLRHALVQLHAVHRDHALALKTPGACQPRICCVAALATAKPPLIAVYNTGILSTRRTRTIVCFRAGPAQVGVVGYANVHHVRSPCPHLGTGPSLRTLLLAHPAAHGLAHVLHAPTRLAVGVGETTVQKAPFARRTLERRLVEIGLVRYPSRQFWSGRQVRHVRLEDYLFHAPQIGLVPCFLTAQSNVLGAGRGRTSTGQHPHHQNRFPLFHISVLILSCT